MDNLHLEFSRDEESGFHLRTEMFVALPIGTVFGFFSDAMQLQRITPPWLNFSVLTPPPIQMQAGLLLDYRLYLHRIPIKWRTRISKWEPPYRFVDEQIRGPYKRWHHEHTFEEVVGGTIVRDNVHYIPRGGRLVHDWFIRPDLEKIFKFRQATLANIFAEIASQSTRQTA